MSPEESEERIKIFLSLADALPGARRTIDNVFRLVSKYDVPKHVDRNFIYDCLITYYSKLELYENCAVLLKLKEDTSRKKRITIKGLTRSDLTDLRMLGFKVPDSVKLKVLLKLRKKDND
jgi:hypothetical protein